MERRCVKHGVTMLSREERCWACEHQVSVFESRGDGDQPASIANRLARLERLVKNLADAFTDDGR